MIAEILGLHESLDSSGTTSPAQWLVDWVRGGTATASGENINEETALSCAAVKAAVCVLSETVAALPLEVFERLQNGGHLLAPNRSEYRLLHDEPNEETSSYIWRETLESHVCRWGNAYAEIERAIDGTPLALWQRSPKSSRTKAVRDKNKRLKYECHDEHGAPEQNIAIKNMLHIPGFGFDGITGYSPVGLLREAIGGNLAAERYASELFANDATARGHYEYPGRLSPDALKRLQATVSTSGSKHGDRHKTRILEEGVKFAANSMNPEDVQMIEARKFGIVEIARFYRITPHLLQDLTFGTYSNVTELGRQFIVYTMMPWLKRWQGEINRKVLSPPFFCEFNTHAFLQGDHAARANYYNKLFQIGGITINRILQKENENDIGPAGDVRFVPMNMVPLEQAIKGPPEKKEPPPVEPPDTEPDEESDTKENAIQQAACDTVLNEVLDRMIRKETNAAKRAAGRPGEFLAWLDTSYAKHEGIVTEAITDATRACLVAYCKPVELTEDVAARIAADHVAESRRQLLKASECKADELPEAVTQCVALWEGRHVNIGELINGHRIS